MAKHHFSILFQKFLGPNVHLASFVRNSLKGDYRIWPYEIF